VRTDVFGEGRDLLFVMGWGNTVDSRHERWFVDYLVEAGFRVHAMEVPTNGTAFDADYLAPVRSYRADIGDHLVLSHSTGGLVVAHLRPDEHAVYLSPWWGMAGDSTLAGLLARLPTDRPLLPAGIDPSGLGELAERCDLTAPDRASPAWLRTMGGAQESVPPIDDGDVVFCSLRDRVVSVRAIGEHASADQVELYDGGHELFASSGRESHAERVVAALDRD